MTRLLIAIDRRTRYLDRVFPRSITRSPEPMVSVDLPPEPWAAQYRGIRIPASQLAKIEKIYGAEAELRDESPLVTMMRYAGTAGGTVTGERE